LAHPYSAPLFLQSPPQILRFDAGNTNRIAVVVYFERISSSIVVVVVHCCGKTGAKAPTTALRFNIQMLIERRAVSQFD
jgi:hypothetical protein